MIRNGGRLVFIIALAVWLSMPQGWSQTASTGALNGTVVDSSGAVVPGVEMTVTNEATGEVRTVSTQSDGVFRVPLLAPGSYRVEARRRGFKALVRPGVIVNVTEMTTLNLPLEVGDVAQKVTVEAAAQLVQTESSTLGQVVGSQVVSDLPLNTRNYTEMLGLSPGVQVDVPDASEFGRGSQGDNLYVHGGKYYDNNYQMNGVGINDLENSGPESGGVAIPNPDTIEEFKVQTGQYDASFGRNAGAVIDIITKGGSNDFHGTIFEFFRNNILNANDFFFNQNDEPRPILRQNQFGFTFGGPIKKDKLFFFTSYQGTRQLNGASSSGRTKSRDSVFLPPFTNDRSAAAIGAMFAGQRGVIQDLFGGVGPAIAADGSNINPVALELLQMKLPNGQYLIPTPEVINPSEPFAAQGFSVFSIPSPFSENQFMTNMDFLQTAKTKISGRFFYASSNQTVSMPGGNLPGFPRLTNDEFRNFTLSDSHTFNEHLYNEARLGFHRTLADSSQEGPFTYSGIGVNAAPQVNDIPYISVGSNFNMGGLFPIRLAQNTYTLEDSLSYVRGRHTLRFGGGVVYAQINLAEFRYNGFLVFLSWPDFLLGLNGTQNGTFGLYSNVYGAEDFIGKPERALRDHDGYTYAQDDIKLTRRLTLNLGVRYERLGALGDAMGRNAGFDYTKGDPNPPLSGTLQGYFVPANYSGGTIPAGVTQTGNDFGNNGDGQNQLEPRIGFAWQPLERTSRVTLRGGYGTYFTRVTGQALIQLIFGAPFFDSRVSLGPTNGAATWANPFPLPIPAISDFPMFPAYSPTTSLSGTYIAPNFRPPMTQQYSLNLQTELARNFLLEIGYVGTRGTHVLQTLSVSQAALASPADPIRGVTTNTVANIAQRVPIEGWAPEGLFKVASEGASWYNDLEVSVTKRMSKGLQFLASYTWSKSLDTDATILTAPGYEIAGNQVDPLARYGASPFNRPQRFVLSYLYQLPGPTSSVGLKGRALKGWSVSGVTTFQAGLPLTLASIVGTNVYGQTYDTAELAPGCKTSALVMPGSVTGKLNNYFNTNCIDRANLTQPLSPTNPAVWPIIGSDGVGTDFGNTKAGIARGPDQRNFDVAIMKSTPILKERVQTEFRGELFNAFNTPQFANPNTDVTSPSFGAISSTSVSARIVQFALKFIF
jgi:hypothetical protein